MNVVNPDFRISVELQIKNPASNCEICRAQLIDVTGKFPIFIFRTRLIRIIDHLGGNVIPMVNIGATSQGVGAIYEVAKRKGYTTSGIVSTQSKLYNVEISQFVDHVFYVEDATWGGFIEGTDRLSPTSTVMVEVSDTMIGIGGGEIGRDELIAAKRSGKEVRFFPAEMNHQIALGIAQKKGLTEPLDFRGAAAKAFES